MPVRPKEQRIADTLRDAARLRERAVELRSLAALIHGPIPRERIDAMAGDLEASAQRLEDLAREMRSDV